MPPAPDLDAIHALRRQLRRREGRYFLRVGVADLPLDVGPTGSDLRAWLDVLIGAPGAPTSDAPALGRPAAGGEVDAALMWALAAIGFERGRPMVLGGALSGRKAVLDWLRALHSAAGQPAASAHAAALGGPPRGCPDYVLAFPDEADADPGLVACRDAVLAAVRAHDAEALVALADRDLGGDPQGPHGRGGLRCRLDEDLTDWIGIEEALTRGGALTERGEYLAPSFQIRWPPAFPGSEEGAVAATPSTPLREAPDPDAEVVRDIGGEYVYVRARGEQAEVSTVDGLVGYVDARSLSDPLCNGYQVVLAPRRRGWRLVFAGNPAAW